MDFKKSDKLEIPSSTLNETTEDYYNQLSDPWATREAFRIWTGKEVRWNLITGKKIVIQQNIISASVVTVPTGFEIAGVNIRAYVNWTWRGSSDVIYQKSSWDAVGVSIAFGSTYPQWITDFNSNTQVLRLFEFNSSNVIRARIENVTSSWFDLNFYEVWYSWYVTIILDCF